MIYMEVFDKQQKKLIPSNYAIKVVALRSK